MSAVVPPPYPDPGPGRRPVGVPPTASPPGSGTRTSPLAPGQGNGRYSHPPPSPSRGRDRRSSPLNSTREHGDSCAQPEPLEESAAGPTGYVTARPNQNGSRQTCLFVWPRPRGESASCMPPWAPTGEVIDCPPSSRPRPEPLARPGGGAPTSITTLSPNRSMFRSHASPPRPIRIEGPLQDGRGPAFRDPSNIIPRS